MLENVAGINALDRSVGYGEPPHDIAKPHAVGKYRRAALEQASDDRQALQAQCPRGIEIDPAVGTRLAAAVLKIDRAGLPQRIILFARLAGTARLAEEYRPQRSQRPSRRRRHRRH